MSGDGEEKLGGEKKKILASVLGQLKYGMDLSKVTLPTFILEPRSLLEKLSDMMLFFHRLARAAEIDDPAERYLEVLRWYILGMSIRPKGVKKPYNPVLGEQFHAVWQIDGHPVEYIAEQVSHHPPASAVLVEDKYVLFNALYKARGITVSAIVRPKSKFLLNSAASLMGGSLKIRFEKLDEEYSVTFPDIFCRGILLGTLQLETAGKIKVSCSTGAEADLEFRSKGMFRGEYGRLDGEIRFAPDSSRKPLAVSGKWTAEVLTTSKETKSTSVFINTETEPRSTEVSVRTGSDLYSRELWAKVTEALVLGDHKTATVHKGSIEQEQREKRKAMKEDNKEHAPAFLEVEGDTVKRKADA